MKIIEACNCYLCEESITTQSEEILADLERSKDLKKTVAFESRGYFIVLDAQGIPKYFDKSDGVDVRMQVGLSKFINSDLHGVRH
jgi:hypothetical protein